MPVQISGVREDNRGFFDRVAAVRNRLAAGLLFQDYRNVVFALDKTHADHAGGKRRYRASYQRLLSGWGFDSNRREGVVLKGWVESRFGISPTFHEAPLTRVGSSEWSAYVEDKMPSMFHNNAISEQSAFLYEFCQWMLTQWYRSGRGHITLYRGVNRFDEGRLVNEDQRGRTHWCGSTISCRSQPIPKSPGNSVTMSSRRACPPRRSCFSMVGFRRSL